MREPTDKQKACRHQYWDLGWCIDCGIHSNDLWKLAVAAAGGREDDQEKNFAFIERTQAERVEPGSAIPMVRDVPSVDSNRTLSAGDQVVPRSGPPPEVIAREFWERWHRKQEHPNARKEDCFEPDCLALGGLAQRFRARSGPEETT